MLARPTSILQASSPYLFIIWTQSAQKPEPGRLFRGRVAGGVEWLRVREDDFNPTGEYEYEYEYGSGFARLGVGSRSRRAVVS